jgi:hypothetical protein
MPKEKQKKFTIKELKEALKFFIENHPETHKDEWYAPIHLMEAEGAERFIKFLETGEYK